MIGYKLTDENNKTHSECQWGKNITHRAKGKGKDLCTDDVIHFYRDPFLAVFANPIQGQYKEETMHLWECECEEVITDGLKSGAKELTTTKQIPIPKMTLEQRLEISIRLAMKIYRQKEWLKWAEAWLSGKDRSVTTVSDAAARDAARDAAYAAAYAADAAACVATRAADAKDMDIIKVIHEVVGKERT